MTDKISRNDNLMTDNFSSCHPENACVYADFQILVSDMYEKGQVYPLSHAYISYYYPALYKTSAKVQNYLSYQS